MAGMTSQPSMGAMVACAKGTKLDTGKQNNHVKFMELCKGIFIVLVAHKERNYSMCNSWLVVSRKLQWTAAAI